MNDERSNQQHTCPPDGGDDTERPDVLERFASVDIEGGSALVYDVCQHTAWITSDQAVPIKSVR